VRLAGMVSLALGRNSRIMPDTRSAGHFAPACAQR
jgi:hypothetical protein